MEISDDHIVALIQGQAATAQAVTDLRGAVDKGFTFIHSEHQELEKTVGKVSARVGKVENKIWYHTGIGTALGVAAGWLGFHIGK
jgi:hypothetical protein